jgi:glycosyltransferase involved in cell wall biosynthesis
LSSALAADRVLFNSSYHRRAFLSEVARALSKMPDALPDDVPGRVERRSSVFPVGIDFEPHRRVKERISRHSGEVPRLVWNHRWEYDKDPDLLAKTLIALKSEGVRFRAIICGQAFCAIPEGFRRIAGELGDSLEHLGFFQDREKYLEALCRSDAVVSTARQEFFGVSVVEAMYLGCLPVLPRSLSYPEIVPERLHGKLLYDGPSAFKGFLGGFLKAPPADLRGDVEEAAARFDWARLAGGLDEIVEETVAEARRRDRQ